MTTDQSVTTLKEVGLPMDVADMLQDAGMGGKTGLSDLAIPFLTLLQTNSPQVNPDNAKYIKGATAGMLYLSVVEKVFEGREQGLVIVPCFYERKLVEWKDRDKGGGIAATHEADSIILQKAKPNERGIPILPNGNSLVETAYYYVLVYDVNMDTWYQAIFPLKSTALKIARKWNSLVATLKIPGTDKQAPRWLHSWNLRTVKEAKQDNVWSSPMLTFGGVVSKEVYMAAKSFCEIAMKGVLNTSTDTEEVSVGKGDTLS